MTVALRAALVGVAAYAMITLLVLALIPLPKMLLFRAVMLAVPIGAAAVAMVFWYAEGAPWPSIRRRRSAAASRSAPSLSRTSPSRVA
jgi:hypothetical protein